MYARRLQIRMTICNALLVLRTSSIDRPIRDNDCLFEEPLNSCRLNLPINWATLEWSYMSDGPFTALPLGVAEDMVDEIRLLDLI